MGHDAVVDARHGQREQPAAGDGEQHNAGPTDRAAEPVLEEVVRGHTFTLFRIRRRSNRAGASFRRGASPGMTIPIAVTPGVHTWPRKSSGSTTVAGEPP